MGIMSSLHENPARSIMGIDASTQSLAFAVFNDRELIKYGKINFTGNSTYDRLADSQAKILALSDDFDVDYIAIEKAIMVRSTDVAIKLGMAVGVIIASVLNAGTEVVEVAPISWQSYIGNTNYNKMKKGEVRAIFPDKSESWIRNEIRARRKRFTTDYFNKKFEINVDDDDVSDSIGIAWYAVNHL